MKDIRVGFGYDVHPVVENRPLFLGGILFDTRFGLDGHSDADVLLHAICDSLLGAANLGDIGQHFPPSDEQYKNIDSKILLKKVHALLTDKGYRISNIDCTVCAESPKIAPFVPAMQACIASLLQINEERVSIKATTNEKLGFIGRKEGIAAFATTLIYRED